MDQPSTMVVIELPQASTVDLNLTTPVLPLAAMALLILTQITTLRGFIASLPLLGAGTCLLDGAMNQTALDWELATGHPVMNLIHACFSGGAVLGSISTGTGLRAGQCPLLRKTYLPMS